MAFCKYFKTYFGIVILLQTSFLVGVEDSWSMTFGHELALRSHRLLPRLSEICENQQEGSDWITRGWTCYWGILWCQVFWAQTRVHSDQSSITCLWGLRKRGIETESEVTGHGGICRSWRYPVIYRNYGDEIESTAETSTEHVESRQEKKPRTIIWWYMQNEDWKNLHPAIQTVSENPHLTLGCYRLAFMFVQGRLRHHPAPW